MFQSVNGEFEFGQLDVRIGVTDAGAISYAGEIRAPGIWSKLGITASLGVEGEIDPVNTLKATPAGSAFQAYGRGTRDHVENCIKKKRFEDC